MKPTDPPERPLTFQRSIGADFDSLFLLMEEMESFCRQSRLSQALILQLQLVLEELVTNAIKYGYPGRDTGQIEVRLTIDPCTARLRITDDGAPFDPLAATPPDFARGLEEREIGGLGIHLIRKMMDTVRYERCGDKNIVTVCKKR
ncbi:MAG TPA: ATP-binding protein [Methylococcus sp.]|nr:ATP-binding protein [Methylococcus sp.]